MFNLQSLLAGRVNAISGRVVVPSASRKRRAGHPGYRALSVKLAKASEQVRGARHGRRD
jgi:hypothetical protein